MKNPDKRPPGALDWIRRRPSPAGERLMNVRDAFGRKVRQEWLICRRYLFLLFAAHAAGIADGEATLPIELSTRAMEWHDMQPSRSAPPEYRSVHGRASPKAVEQQG